MRRVLQTGIIILSIYLCVTMMRPFLTQINLQLSFVNMTRAGEINDAARKNNKSSPAAMQQLRQSEGFAELAVKTTLGNPQVWARLAHITKLMVDFERERISDARARSLLEKVIDYCQVALRLGPDNMELYMKAGAELQLGRLTEAIKDLEAATFYHWTWTPTNSAASTAYVKEIMLRFGVMNYGEKVCVMERLAKRFPHNMDVRRYLARAYYDADRFEEARKCYEHKRISSGFDLEDAAFVAQTYLKERDYRRAAWELCRVLMFNKETSSGKLSPTIRSVEKILKVDPNNADAHFVLGVVQQDKLADYSAAKHHFTSAYKAFSGHFETAKRLSEVCEKLGDDRGAAKWRANAEKILQPLKEIDISPRESKGRTRKAHCIFVEDANGLTSASGEVVDDPLASSGRAILLKSSEGRSVPIKLRCPPLPAGNYELIVRLRTPEVPKASKSEMSKARLAKISILGDNIRRSGSTKPVRRSLYGREFGDGGVYQDRVMEFYHPGLVDFEIMLDYWAACDLYVDRIALACVED